MHAKGVFLSKATNDFDHSNRQNRESGKAEQDRDTPCSMGLIKHKYLITSNKRGVGKTSLATNLAVALSKRELKVGLINLDLHGTDNLKMLSLNGSYEIGENKQFIPKLFSDHLKIISIKSIKQDIDRNVIGKGDLGAHVIGQFVADIDWGKLDYLIVDSPPGTGKESLAVTQSILGAKVIFVSAPESEPLPQIAELINFYKTAPIPILGFIENMSGFWCEDCARSGESTFRESNIMNVDYLGRIPFDPHMDECTTSDQFFIEMYPDSEATHGYELIADIIVKDSRSQDP